jgi:hypothetical protein
LSPPVGIHKIKHVIAIMQENRSFDHYFGTYPGADGFPRTASGEFAVCVPDPVKGDCQRPYHDVRDLNSGGPHGEANAIADVNGGKMNGFIGEAELARHKGCTKNPNDPICSQRSANPDVMGYHDGSDIPNYGPTRETSSSGPHVRAERFLEPARAPLHGLGVVGQVLPRRRSDELRQRAAESGVAKRPRCARLRLDGSHVPPAQASRQLALLGVQRHGARL